MYERLEIIDPDDVLRSDSDSMGQGAGTGQGSFLTAIIIADECLIWLRARI